MPRFPLHWLASGLLLATAVGCSSLSTNTIQYLGVPRYEPSDWQQVEILHGAPGQAHEKLGEVVASVSLNPAPSVEKLETVLRRKAANLGADAIILVRDQVETTGSWVTGPYWAPTVSPIKDRVIVAVAIKYR
ncbi:MAG: hypothetical protein H7A45_06955 [Verrucomicrobiales bacterium]|nr:hypothetical protein [Verrucomicrobiales bacterium]MCP5527433.1 hypothetical protein [Verrucomicrobiales bacterium]